MTADEDWPRLARFVRDRRDELGMSQEDVRAAGGPSTATMNMIENPDHRRAGYSRSTYSKLERALRWQPMSARAILKGGDPSPVDDAGRSSGRPAPQPDPAIAAIEARLRSISPAIANPAEAAVNIAATVAFLKGLTDAERDQYMGYIGRESNREGPEPLRQTGLQTAESV